MLRFIIQITLELLLLCLLVFNSCILNNHDTTFTLVALIIFLGIVLFFEKKRVSKSRTVNDVMFVVIGISILVIGVFYFVGFFSGFSINYNSIFKNYIQPISWIKVFLIIFVSEIIRYRTITEDDNNQKVKKMISDVLMLGIFLLVDMAICTKVYNLTTFNQIYEFISLVVIQSISKNIFLNYLIKESGLTPNLLYRLLMELYVYFLPVIPRINVFIEGVVLLITPYFMYIMIESITKRKQLGPARKNKDENKISTIIGTVVFVILVTLVSREFEYCMIAIGSGSMTGTINKGDAVIYKVYDNGEDVLNIGDVLVFYKDNMIVVHRMVKKYMIYGEEAYQTKGDANEKVDNWIVKEKDVIGVVKQRIPFIAWSSVKLNELF